MGSQQPNLGAGLGQLISGFNPGVLPPSMASGWSGGSNPMMTGGGAGTPSMGMPPSQISPFQPGQDFNSMFTGAGYARPQAAARPQTMQRPNASPTAGAFMYGGPMRANG